MQLEYLDCFLLSQLEQPNSIEVEDSINLKVRSEKQFKSAESPESSARMASAPVAESDFDGSLDNFDTEESIQIENLQMMKQYK